jgi:hypothetical protein
MAGMTPGTAGIAMALTEARILECAGHDELLELLFSDLRTRLPPEEPFHMERFLQKIRTIPVGLRAMAVTFELDVSMALDDLGWHFGNWCYRPYCDQTLWGLRELEAGEYAEMFAKAYELAQSYWTEIRDPPHDDFAKWYNESDFEKATEPLSFRWWELQKIDGGIFGHWTRYARKYPHKVAQIAS